MAGLRGHGSTEPLAPHKSTQIYTNPHLDGQVRVVQELELRGLAARLDNSGSKMRRSGPAQPMVVAHHR